MWKDIACIVFTCVTMNHLGLIGEMERIMGKRLIVLNCPKCSSFWFSIVCGMGKTGFSLGNIIPLLAISFFASYMAIWLELLEGFIDTLYTKCYDKIYPAENDTTSADGIKNNTDCSVSEL